MNRIGSLAEVGVIDHPRLLAFETSGPQCSVALTDGAGRVAMRRAHGVNDHAKVLTPLVAECMGELGMRYSDLEGVAVSNGPGSYTGLRIGLSTAKGLCYALGVRLMAVETLLGLAHAMRRILGDRLGERDYILPLMDARRMEVYMQLFSAELLPQDAARPALVPEQLPALAGGRVYYGGSGAQKVMPLVDGALWHVVDDLDFSAGDILALAQRDWEKSDTLDIAYVEPYYLKEFQATTPRRSLPLGATTPGDVATE